MASKNRPPAFSFDTIFKSYPHIAEQIVKNIPLHLRWDVAAVNRNFYAMICEMDKKKHRMKIRGNKYQHKEILESDLMDSILNSCRVIDELRISKLDLNPQILQQLIKIAEKFGMSIRTLNWSYCKIDLKKDIHLLIQFFEELANLKVLDVEDRDGSIIVENEIAFKPVLKNLKKFSSGNGNSHIMSKFIAKDTLTEFYQEFGRLFDYDEFIRNQANLDSLEFIEQSVESCRKITNVGLYKHLKLSQFYFCQDYREQADGNDEDLFVRQLIHDHPNLHELCYYHIYMEWNDTTLEAICEHGKGLKRLSLTMDENNCRSLLKLGRLKHLEKITITIDEVDNENDEEEESTLCDALAQFSKLSMPTVRKLHLYIDRAIQSNVGEILINFSNFWSNLEYLYCCLSSENEKLNQNVIDAILQEPSKLKSIKLEYSKIIDDGEMRIVQLMSS